MSKEANEEGKHEMCYLLDKVMGFEENQRLTEDAMVKVYEEAVQTSYRRGGEAVNEADSISKTAVKEILHKTQFPEIMPEDLQEVVILHYFQDLKLKEVADIIGIGLPLVKYRIGKAKELLSVYLGDKK